MYGIWDGDGSYMVHNSLTERLHTKKIIDCQIGFCANAENQRAPLKLGPRG